MVGSRAVVKSTCCVDSSFLVARESPSSVERVAHTAVAMLPVENMILTSFNASLAASVVDDRGDGLLWHR